MTTVSIAPERPGLSVLVSTWGVASFLWYGVLVLATEVIGPGPGSTGPVLVVAALPPALSAVAAVWILRWRTGVASAVWDLVAGVVPSAVQFPTMIFSGQFGLFELLPVVGGLLAVAAVASVVAGFTLSARRTVAAAGGMGPGGWEGSL